MTARYYITPYDPGEWVDENKESYPESDLEIDVEEFMAEATKTWDYFRRDGATSWYFVMPDGNGAFGSILGIEKQLMSIEAGAGINEFILWYRSYITNLYPLYLFAEGDSKSLILTSETTIQDIQDCTGFP